MKTKTSLRSAGFINIVAVSIFITLGLCLTTAVPAAAQSAQITLLHIGDTHSHLDAWGPKDTALNGTLGGLPKVAAIVTSEKTADPQALFVHSGDFMEGDLFFVDFFGVRELQFLHSIGLDAMALGNHDFVFGGDFLAGVFEAAWPQGGVAVLGANITTTNTSLAPWITPAIIKDVNGVKVGLFGLTVRKAAREFPSPAEVVKYDTIAPQTVAALRAQGAQVVVCIAHIGMAAARSLATSVPGIDVIVNGHDHAVLEEPERIGSTVIVSAGDHYRWVGRLRLAVGGGQVSMIDYALLSADANTPALPAVQELVDQLKAEIVARHGDVYYQPIASADPELSAASDAGKAKRDTALGNLFTDAYRAWTGTDIAIEAAGYLGDAIPAGPVVGADVFRAMSYAERASGQPTLRPWRLVTFRAIGADLMSALEKTLFAGGDSFPQVSGIRFDYDSSAPPMQKILGDTVHVGGHKLVASQSYSVTVTEGVWQALQSKSISLPMQDVIFLSDTAFGAASSYAGLKADLGLATANRIRDISAIPGAGR